MKSYSKLIIASLLLIAFIFQDSHSKNSNPDESTVPKIGQVFDSSKWQIKQGKDYPYRNDMLNDIVYTDKFRQLNKSELLIKLGEPSYYRDDKNYLHYIITQKRILSWPLHTKVLVIKLKSDESVEWIKIHK